MQGRQSVSPYAGSACLVLVGALIAYFLFMVAFLEQGGILVAHDDAFINYVYSRNLAEGAGLVFNAGEYVWGYTSPAQVLLLAVAAALGFDLLVFTPLCGVAFACISGLLIFRLLSRMANSPWGAALAAICLITLTPIFVLYMTLEGNFLIASQLLFLELLAARRMTAAVLAARNLSTTLRHPWVRFS